AKRRRRVDSGFRAPHLDRRSAGRRTRAGSESAHDPSGSRAALRGAAPPEGRGATGDLGGDPARARARRPLRERGGRRGQGASGHDRGALPPDRRPPRPRGDRRHERSATRRRALRHDRGARGSRYGGRGHVSHSGRGRGGRVARTPVGNQPGCARVDRQAPRGRGHGRSPGRATPVRSPRHPIRRVTTKPTERVRLAIVGSGPAGYTAAIYAARAELAPLVVAGAAFGGQLMVTTDVENYPGFPEAVAGPELVELFRKQAERFGARVLFEDATAIAFGKRPFALETDSAHI